MSAPRPLSSLGDLYSWLSLGRRGPVTPRGSPSTSTSRPGRQQPPGTPLCEKSPDPIMLFAIPSPFLTPVSMANEQFYFLLFHLTNPFPPFILNLFLFSFNLSIVIRSNKSFTCYSIVLKKLRTNNNNNNRKFEFSPLP